MMSESLNAGIKYVGVDSKHHNNFHFNLKGLKNCSSFNCFDFFYIVQHVYLKKENFSVYKLCENTWEFFGIGMEKSGKFVTKSRHPEQFEGKKNNS